MTQNPEVNLESAQKEIGDELGALLEKLSTEGKATHYRDCKHDLVMKIPELAPWIETVRAGATLDVTNQAVYTLSGHLKGRIHLKPPSDT